MGLFSKWFRTETTNERLYEDHQNSLEEYLAAYPDREVYPAEAVYSEDDHDES